MFITHLRSSRRIFQFAALAITFLITQVAVSAQATRPDYVFSHWAGPADGSSGTADGTGSQARFNHPTGIAIDPSGNVYVSDMLNSTIRKITPDGTVTTLAGAAGQPGYADGTGASARFNRPVDLALDRAGNLYLVEGFNSNIRKITPAGVVTSLLPPTTLLYNLSGIAVDSTGTVYVADSDDHIVEKISSTGQVTIFAGAAGQSGSVDGIGTAARFNSPSGLAFDSSDNLYVVDAINFTIRKITPSGLVTTLAGSPGQSGSVDGLGAAARFLPISLATDKADNIYVTDRDVIRKITPMGMVTTLAGKDQQRGNIDGTGTAARFNIPGGVTVDDVGNLYIVDTDNHAIRKGLRVEVPLPVIVTQPASQTVRISSGVTFSLVATNATSYTWVLEDRDGGFPMAVTSVPTWTMSPAYPVNAGTYHVTVTGPGGTVRSERFTLTVVEDFMPLPEQSKLINISTRSFVGAGENVLIAGFIIRGTAPKQVLIRASGPALLKYSVTGVLPDPTLELHDLSTVIRTNDNWGDDPASKSAILAATAATGAFPLDEGSKDAAILLVLQPGGYTAVVKDKNGATGVGLVEVYEVDQGNNNSRLINLSSRSLVKTGNDVQIAGFIISGAHPKKVIIRASGPALTQYGIQGALADPFLEIHDDTKTIVTNDNWDAALRADFLKISLDNWPVGSADAAVVLTLNPGKYTAIVSGKNQTSGVALVEVFDAD